LALVRDFDRDTVANRKRMSDFLQRDPEVFYRTTIEILRKDAEARAAQHLVALLISGDLLFRALCDPSLDRERAGELARQARLGDPAVDIRLARQLADSNSSDGSVAPGMAERLLEIVDQISDGNRLLPSLMRILRHDNPYLRSKAVLMIGRSGRSLSWIQKRLQESDTRVRANAIEAIWGVDSPQARELLNWATQDGNNRVVGNALLGLYRMGESSSLTRLAKMAGHDVPGFRRTAAWAMGETGDPRFSEVLGRMIADDNGGVRKGAFAAVRRIREAVVRVTQAPEWPVAITPGAKNPRTGERRVDVAVVTADGRGSPPVLPVQFILAENAQTVWSYRVREKMAPGPLTVLFLFPRKRDSAGQEWDHGALRCLNWKRSTDLWSAVPYSGDDDPSEGPADLELPSFIADSAQAAKVFQKAPTRLDCTGFWTAIRRAVLPGNSVLRGERHLIVLAPDDVGNNGDQNLAAAVHASRTSVQVVSHCANPALQEFCRRVEGRFRHVKDASGIEEAVSLAYLSLLARYEIRYRSDAPDGASLKLRVHTPAGWGEITVEL
jgi:HEAT repeat protein